MPSKSPTATTWRTPALGAYLVDFPERVPEAVSHFQTALQIKPDYEEAHNNLGVALFRLRRPSSDAVAEYEAALRLRPNAAEPHNNLATALLQVPGRLPEAIAHYEAALRINPDYPNAHENLAGRPATGPEPSAGGDRAL